MYFKELEEYYFDRDTFTRVVLDAARRNRLYNDEILCSACEEGICAGSFKFFKHDESYYILNVDSGVLVGWYKHLGRCNVCNQINFTENDLFDYCIYAFKEVLLYYANE